MNYLASEIEPKWQKYWQESGTFETSALSNKPKYYILDMFPYPSGSGLHVGHGIGYTVTDIIARRKRMQGFHVLHPMGWDSFGLPAEQYAIRTGTHPEQTTQKNIERFKQQLLSYGYSYDWSREIKTSDRDYYKWTQWIFTVLYERGLAYQAKMYVNYCPALGTVLANEEVENGKSVEGGYPVIRKALQQWVLKITQYADRLLQDLDLIDWPANLKKQQENWIGRSEGALVEFLHETSGQKIQVYTTRPDTLFGVTYIVLAPEHPLVSQMTCSSHQEAVNTYQKQAQLKSDLQRTDLNKEKSGVFTGSYVKHPITGELLPVWVADYVLANYATGAVMAVPAHDERDWEFAKTHKLKVSQVIAGLSDQLLTGSDMQSAFCDEGVLVNSAWEDINLNGLDSSTAKSQVCDWLQKHQKGKRQISYKLRDWLFSRQRYWGEPIPIMHFEDASMRSLSLDELPLTPPQVSDYKPSPDGLSPLAKETSWVELTDPKTGMRAWRETHTMPQWAGSCWYYLRFIDPHNHTQAWDRDKERYWMPVDTYVGGAEHAVLHLLYARFWHKVLYDCGLVTTPEPFMQLRNQGMVVAKSYKLATGGYISPQEAELTDQGWVHRSTQERVIEQVEKMSKSKLNGVNPEEVMQEHGADALRLYSMFMGPYDKEKLWDTKAVSGCSRFLKRVWALYDESKRTQEEIPEAMIATHLLCEQVNHELEQWQFNVAIAKMMEYLNKFEKLSCYPQSCLDILARLLAPFAPHIAEELWQKLGHPPSVAFAAFPKPDPHWIHQSQDQQVMYVIQVNGKVRGRVNLSKGFSQSQVEDAALADENVRKFTDGKPIAKVIFVQDKLLNIVVAG